MKDNQILPACESADAPLQSETNPPPRVLVVDDDGDIRGFNAEVLMRCGYEVDAAEDGAAGWEALQANRYDLMITDNNMPKVSGVELLKKLHAVRRGLPVIMATGTLPKEEFARYPWLEPAAILLKPYSVEELLGTVRKVLREAESPAIVPLPRPTHSPQRILVVDEDRDLRCLYSEALTGAGFQVAGAEHGAAGWEALQASHYDLLITEHDLPKLTGIELVRKLRAALMALPVVMAAARLPVDELAKSPSLRLAATLEEPFPIDTLLATVKNVLRATASDCAEFAPPTNRRSQPPATGLRQ